MTKSFKPLFAGAVGLALAASCFASDAYAFKLPPGYSPSRPVSSGWNRPPSFQPSRPGVSLGSGNMGHYIARPYQPFHHVNPQVAYRAHGYNQQVKLQQFQQQQAQYQQQQAQQRQDEMRERMSNQSRGCNRSGSPLNSWIPGQSFC
jgi:hypothetical protein